MLLLTREDLRYDCRFRTGAVALQCLREVIETFQRRGSTFVPMRELAEHLAREPRAA